MRHRPLQGWRVLVTGGTGFIGRHLVNRLAAEGAAIVVPVSPASARNGAGPTVSVDLLNFQAVRDLFREVRPNAVVHAAGGRYHLQTASDRLASFALSTAGTANLLEASLDAGVSKLLYLGSSLVYRAQSEPMREDQPLDPLTARGAAKAAGSVLWRQFIRAQGISGGELRLFSVYGPGESESRLIPKLLRAALEGTPFPLLRGARHDFTYVADVVDACIRALVAELPSGEVINIATGRQTANEDVVAAVERVTGNRVPVVEGAFERRPWDADAWHADTAKARELLGWSAATALEGGLRLTCEWMMARGRDACSASA